MHLSSGCKATPGRRVGLNSCWETNVERRRRRQRRMAHLPARQQQRKQELICFTLALGERRGKISTRGLRAKAALEGLARV